MIKSIITLLFLNFICLISFGQFKNTNPNWLGNNYLAYKGMELYIDENYSVDLIKKFFSNSKDVYLKDNDDSVLFKKGSGFWDRITSSLDSLKGKTFLVSSITNDVGQEINEYNYTTKNIVFHLKNLESGKFIYYKYSDESDIGFPFLIKNSKDKDKILRARIIRNVDDFTNEIHISSPYHLIPNTYFGRIKITINKFINKGVPKYYLFLYSYGSQLNIGKKGAIILFNDNSKLNKPNADIDVENDRRSEFWNYSTSILLNESELRLLSLKKIKKFRLYIHDENISDEEAEIFMRYINIIKLMK